MKGYIAIWIWYLCIAIIVHVLLISMVVDTTGTLPFWLRDYGFALFVFIESIIIFIGMAIAFK